MTISAINLTPAQALQRPLAAQSTNAQVNQTGVQPSPSKDSDGDYDANRSSPVASTSSATLSALDSLKPGG
jgi:hypothetical protein